MEEKDLIVEQTREIFHVRTLQEKVWRLESENKELKVNNSILQTQYNSQCETQSDILRTLHANLDENYSKIEDSELRIQKLEEQIENERQDFKDELEVKRAEWNNKLQELQIKNDQLTASLNELDEFQKKKDFMEAELQRLKQDLEDQDEAHRQEISNFDRKKAIEIDQLKKDMARSIKDTREYLRQRTKDQLDDTTKRTIMENEQKANELTLQSKETARLLDLTETLSQENAQLRRNLVIHKDLENELARRTHVYQKLIKKMRQRQGAEEQASAEKLSMDAYAEDDLPKHRSISSASSRGAGEANAELSRENQELKSALTMVRNEFAQYRHDHATLTQLQDQSTRLVIGTLYELKNQRECDPFPPATYDEHANWQFTNMTNRQKEYFFRVLLEKLNSSMCSSCFPVGSNTLSPQQSNSSLPQIGKSEVHSGNNNFSQFLWSVASHGAPPQAGTNKDVSHKSIQTETDVSDPCFKEGLWNPTSRAPHLTQNMVTSTVRDWGRPAMTVRTRNGPSLHLKGGLKGRIV